MKSETPRMIAKDIVDCFMSFKDSRYSPLVAAVAAALNAERERCAKAVCNLCRRPEDYHAAEPRPEDGEFQHKRIGHEDEWQEVCKASAIRRLD